MSITGSKKININKISISKCKYPSSLVRTGIFEFSASKYKPMKTSFIFQVNETII